DCKYDNRLGIGSKTCDRPGRSLRPELGAMSTSMRAAFFADHGRFALRDLPRPAPGPGEVLVDVHACGICGSDIHFYGGGAPPPRTCPGHEIAGRVAAGSTLLSPGTPVVIEPLRSCGVCLACRRGEPNLCPRVEIMGSRLPGGFADALVAPLTSVHPLPDDGDRDLAILVEP